MHFDWLNPEAAGFKSQAAVSIKTKQDLKQETWKVVVDPLPHSSKKVRFTAAEEQVRDDFYSSYCTFTHFDVVRS